jgi:hypothetical protein
MPRVTPPRTPRNQEVRSREYLTGLMLDSGVLHTLYRT